MSNPSQPSVLPNSSLIAQDFGVLGELGEGLEDIGGRGSINSTVGKSSFLLRRLSCAAFRQGSTHSPANNRHLWVVSKPNKLPGAPTWTLVESLGPEEEG